MWSIEGRGSSVVGRVRTVWEEVPGWNRPCVWKGRGSANPGPAQISLRQFTILGRVRVSMHVEHGACKSEVCSHKRGMTHKAVREKRDASR